MTHPHDEQIDPELTEEEDLENTDVRGQLGKDPEEQRNREDAPVSEEVAEQRAE